MYSSYYLKKNVIERDYVCGGSCLTSRKKGGEMYDTFSKYINFYKTSE